MSFTRKHSIALFFILNLHYYFNFTHATTLSIQNNCPYTIWASAILPGGGGGKQLNRGQARTLNVDGGALSIWGRTKCSFNGDGRGKCESGDCNGLLECQGFGGTPPYTLAEFSMNQPNNIDFLDLSLANGFNVPMELSPISISMSNGSASGCTATRVSCMKDVNGPCPTELRDPGGCNSPCNVFQNDQFCCTTGNCGPTVYSRFFKNACPNAYSYPLDDENTTFSCPSGTNYEVVFCP